MNSARRFVEAQLRKWSLEELTDTIDIIVSELLTNSIKATGLSEIPHDNAEIAVPGLAVVATRLRRNASSVFAEIWDADARPPIQRLAADYDEDGRGLTLVTAMSKAWAYYISPAGGKVTWAEVTIPARLAAASLFEEPCHPALPRRIPSTEAARPATGLTDLDLLRRVRDGLRNWRGDHDFLR